jgi:hypothetical protein
MANPQTVPYRCTNKWGDHGEGKCAEYGSKSHPHNIVEIEVAKLPPRGISPKCPCCNRDLIEVKGGGAGIGGGGRKPDKEGPKVSPWLLFTGIVLMLVAAYILYLLLARPELRFEPHKIVFNSERRTQILKVTNVGRAALRVEISAGRDAIIVKPTALTVAPGKTESVEVAIEQAASKITQIDTSIELRTNDPQAKSVSLEVAWRNIDGLLSEKFEQAHANLYR